MDADTNDIASNGFGNTLTRDGQGQPTANLPMAGFRHTGVQNGVARSDYAALGQAQDGLLAWTSAGGTSDAITVTYTPALTALADGQLCFFRATAANTTTTPTFAPNSLTAHTITKLGGAAVLPGDIAGNLTEVILRYNLSNTRWELLNPQIQGANWVAAGGTHDAITATYSPAIATLYDGLLCFFRAGAANQTTTPTFAPNGLTAHTITRAGGTAVLVGDIPGNLAEVILRYNLSNTRWELLNPYVQISPTVQRFTSGTGTATPSSGVVRWKVRMCGSGGGGGAATTGNGGTGGSTTLASWGAGAGTGGVAGGGAGGAGGSGGGTGTGTLIARFAGGSGSGGGATSTTGTGSPGGIGGCNPFGGSGAGGGFNAIGTNAAANTGAGGGGGGAASANSGGGGGAGEYVEFYVINPTATSYAVGAGGSLGTGSGTNGGAGAAGIIIIEEFYQ